MTEALYDANAEQAVLGAILIDGSIIGKIREIVSYKDFYDSNYSLIFRAMEWLNNNNVPIDLVTLSDALGRVGGLERVNGSSGLAELAGGAITPVHAESYARLVAEYSGKRSVGNLAKDISTLSQNKAPLPEIIDAVKDKVEKINQKNNKQSKYEVVPMTDFIDEAENRYRLWGKMQGLSTGFSNIDRLTLGLVGGELIIIAGQTSRGKQQRVSEIIPTPSGDKRFGDLKPGDYVFGSDGKPTKVTGVFPQGRMPIYRVIFSDGSYLDTGRDHLWTLQRKGRPDRIMTSHEMMMKLPSQSYYIPLTKPLEYSDGFSPVDGYELGMYIADGSFNGSQVHITKKRGAVADCLASIDKELIRYDHPNTCGYFRANKAAKITSYVVQSGLSKVKSADKFIPKEWFRKSVDKRKSLMAGLLDGDGSVQNNAIMYCTTSSKLAEDVVRLVTSLGGIAKITTIKHRRGNYISVRISALGFNPFRASKWRTIYKPGKNSIKHRKVVGVEIVGEDEAMCISVEAKDSLYVADTRFNIVTHNTLLSMNIANNVAKTGRIVLFVTLEMTHVELTSRYMYLNGGESKDFIEVSTNTLFQKNDELGWKDIDGLIRNAKEELGADLVVVDHLHYFTRETEKASEDLGRITKEFKKNAIRHNIPIILVSHVRKLGKDEKLSGESLRGCLPEDERVLTNRGNIPIKDVKVGDKVLSVSKIGKTVESSVTAVWKTGEKEILEMTLNDGRKIRSSSEHRFLTPLGFWEAGELHRGCPLVGLADLIPGREFKETMRQFGIQSVCSVGVMKTYDLEVPSTHNYVVNGIITHNSSYIAQDADIVLLVDRDPANNDMGVMIDKNRNRGKLSDRVKSWGDMTEREINTVYLEFNNTRLKEKLQ